MRTPLADLLIERIQANGPITFAEFMNQALYHPDLGYYTAGPERSGWGGHFITAPQLDPAFGELWARALSDLWVDCGRPERFDVIEIGPGEGGFASALLSNLTEGDFADAVSLTLVERSPELRQRQEERLSVFAHVTWVKDLSEVHGAAFGCVIGNEVLDNQPVHLVEQTESGIAELMVTAPGGELALEPSPLSDDARSFLGHHRSELPLGHRFEISPASEALVSAAAGAIGSGAVIFIDYGAPSQELAAKGAGSLVCYSASGTDSEPLEQVGEKDLTVFANWTVAEQTLVGAGCRTVGPLLQADVLRSFGIASIDQRLKAEHQSALAEKKGGDALRALSRRQALGVLLDRGGLGGLGVLVGLKGLPESNFPRVE